MQNRAQGFNPQGFNPKDTKVCVVGLGYIGLPTAAILATKGYNVLGVDVTPSIVETINAGKIHIVEPDLDILVKSAVQSGRLRASSKPENADIFILCVPTPFKEGNQPDLSYVESATESIVPFVKSGNLVILESTSPVGTTDRIAEQIREKRGFEAGKEIFVAHCPERVLPGQILKEAIENDRILGGVTLACAERTAQFYRTFVQGRCLTTSASAAEMTKLVENSFRDVNIAFANELSIICDKLGLNVWEVIRLANHHPRVKILNPGPGVGGHCIAVDPWFIVASAPEESRLMRTARLVNDSKPKFVVERVEKMVAGSKLPVGVLGLTFKANVDDFRESPSLEIAHELTKHFGKDQVLCHDPYASSGNGKLKELTMTDLDTLLSKAKALVLLVDHREYERIPLRAEQPLFDTRGFLKK